MYQDGVRVNEPFGDTVNWALIPESAIDTVYLMPGSNPLFGLNALGGAIAIQTKDGFTHPGTRAEVYGGSFGRVGVAGRDRRLDRRRARLFRDGLVSSRKTAGATSLRPRRQQLFGKLAWRTATCDARRERSRTSTRT